MITASERLTLLGRVSDLRGNYETLNKAGRAKEAQAVMKEIESVLDKLEIAQGETR